MLTVYISVSATIFLVSCFFAGYVTTKEDNRIYDIVGGALLALLWPLCLVGCCILAPFYLSYYLGKYCGKKFKP